MSRVTLKTIRRQSLWEVYNKRCFYCERLLLFNDCEIDHIISQYYKKNTNERERILKHYNLPEDFDIDSIENQVPCHSVCNKKKGNKQFSKNAIIFYLEQAKSKCKNVEECENKYEISLEKDYGRGLIEMILERGLLTKSDIIRIVEYYELSRLNLSDETDIIIFSLSIEDLFESNSLPDDVPLEYPYLCDWLQDNLVEHLASIISTPYYLVEDFRNGESFALRFVFLRLKMNEFSKFSINYWKISNEGTFTQMYGESPNKYFKIKNINKN